MQYVFKFQVFVLMPELSVRSEALWFFFVLFWAMPQGMQDIISPIRDGNCTPSALEAWSLNQNSLEFWATEIWKLIQLLSLPLCL